jgi:hypothetical protein
MSFRELLQRYNYREHLLAKTPNAGRQARLKAGARDERTL